MEEWKDIIVADSLGIVKTDIEEQYLSHLLCLGGTCRFFFNGQEFELREGDLCIIRRRSLVEKIRPSADFRYKIIYAKPGFIELSTPQSNYAMKGQLSLFNNPVIHLIPEQQILCRRNFDILEQRVNNTEHLFYRETLINAMQTAILDFFDFHARIYGNTDISMQNASIMSRFLTMLEEGTYREHREVSYYADRLCVTAKYLSEVTKKSKRICRQLLDKPLYNTRYFPAIARQIADFRANIRYVRFLITCLFQPLCTAEFGCQAIRL